MDKPLSRNRNYQLLWSSRALGEISFNMVTLALPILVLTSYGSTTLAGLVSGASSAAQVVGGVVGGALVDRWNRRSILLATEGVRAAALAVLTLLLWVDEPPVWHLVVTACLLGLCNALHEPAGDALIPLVVPAAQLSTAVALTHARGWLGQMVGTASSGALFAVVRFAPFLAGLVANVLSFVMLTFFRQPPRQRNKAPLSKLASEVWHGVRWVWNESLIRVTASCAFALNLCFYALYLVVVAAAVERGASSQVIGLMLSMLGIGGLLGALVAVRLSRVMSPYLAVIGVFWAFTMLSVLIAWSLDRAVIVALSLSAMAFVTPTANTVFTTYQMMRTPDRMRGRLSGVLNLFGGVATAIGPVVGGVLLEFMRGGSAVLLLAGAVLLLAVTATVSRTMRDFSRRQAVAVSLAEGELDLHGSSAPQPADRRDN